MASPGGVAGAVTALAERRRLEELARLGYIDPQLTEGVPRGASYAGDLPLLMPPQAPPLPRGEPARPGGYLPPVPDDVPRMRPPTALEQLRQTIVDYVQAQEAGEAPMHPLRRPAAPGGLPGTGELTRPTIGPASDQQRISQAIADVLGFGDASWAPNLVEGSYGLRSEPEEGGMLSALAALVERPEVQAAFQVPLPPFNAGAADTLGMMDALSQLVGLNGPDYEPGGGPDKMMKWGMMADWPGKGTIPFTKWLAERGPLPGRGPVTAKEAISRQVVTNLFRDEGDIQKALANLDEVGVTGKKLDTAIQAGINNYMEVMARSHNMDMPGAGLPVAHPDVQRHIVDLGLTVPRSTLWYPNSTVGYRMQLGADPLAPPLISVTSSGIHPHGNTDRALPILAGRRAGVPLDQIFKDFRMQGSVKDQVARVLDAEDIFAQMPYGTDAESMAAFDRWIRTAPESEVRRLLAAPDKAAGTPAGVFPEPKTFNFWRDNTGDPRFFTTDSWQGRNAGFSMWDPDVIVQTKNKDKATGLYKTKQGGWIEPEESQYYSTEVRSPRKQEKGIPRQSEINLIEDFMTHVLAPEYNLSPRDLQAAHWIGGMKLFDKMPEPYLAAPYGTQLDWRLRFAGVPDRGIGNVRPTKEWQQIYDAMLRNSAPVAKGNRVIYGKDDPRVILW